MTNIFNVMATTDASVAQFPENTPSSFKMQLPGQVHLRDEWEIAMRYYLNAYLAKWMQQTSVKPFMMQ